MPGRKAPSRRADCPSIVVRCKGGRGVNNVGQAFFDRAKWVARAVAKRRWLALAVMGASAVAAAIGVSLAPGRTTVTGHCAYSTH